MANFIVKKLRMPVDAKAYKKYECHMSDFKSILARWETRAALAADLQMPYDRIDQWWKRNTVPAKHWPALIKAAKSKGFDDITAESLLRTASEVA
jgi:propanediol dehydratase small subunit